MQPVEYIKKHKIIFGVSAVALVGIIAYSMFGNNAGASSSGTTTIGPTPQEIEANTQIALAQIQATNAAQQVQAQVGVRLSEINAQQTIATLELQNENLQAVRQAEVAIYTVGQQAAVEQSRLASEERINQNALQTALAQSALTAQTTQYVANTQLQAVQAQVSGDVAAAKIQASAQKSVAKTNLIGSLIGGIFSIFSDSRLKTDIRKICTDKYGVTWYSYRYRNEAQRMFPSVDPSKMHTGVLAQDLLSTPYRHAVSMQAGYYVVDYNLLPAPPFQRVAA